MEDARHSPASSTPFDRGWATSSSRGPGRIVFIGCTHSPAAPPTFRRARATWTWRSRSRLRSPATFARHSSRPGSAARSLATIPRRSRSTVSMIRTWGFYAEFLVPLQGSERKRDGKPDVTASKAGIIAQKLRHLDLLLVAPWSGPDRPGRRPSVRRAGRSPRPQSRQLHRPEAADPRKAARATRRLRTSSTSTTRWNCSAAHWTTCGACGGTRCGRRWHQRPRGSRRRRREHYSRK